MVAMSNQTDATGTSRRWRRRPGCQRLVKADVERTPLKRRSRPKAASSPVLGLPDEAKRSYHSKGKSNGSSRVISRVRLCMLGLSIWHWILLGIVLIMTVATGMIAHRKNRSVRGWLFLGLIFNPVVLIVLLSLPGLAPNQSSSDQ